MENKLIKKLENIFLIVELIIFGMYLIPEYFDVKVNYDNFKVLFFLIVVIFLESFIYFRQWSKENLIVRIGFFFTLCADYLMTYLNKYYILSICFFFLTQLCYFILINCLFNKKYLKSSIISYGCVVVLLIVIASILELLEPLSLTAIIYISLSLTNIVYLIRIKNKTRSIKNFLLGLVLFLLCDLCIGLRNVGINEGLFINLISDCIWLFYAPSQMVLVQTLSNIELVKGELYEESIES